MCLRYRCRKWHEYRQGDEQHKPGKYHRANRAVISREFFGDLNLIGTAREQQKALGSQEKPHALARAGVIEDG